MKPIIKVKLILLVLLLSSIMGLTLLAYHHWHKPQLFIVAPLFMIVVAIPVLMSLFGDLLEKS